MLEYLEEEDVGTASTEKRNVLSFGPDDRGGDGPSTQKIEDIRGDGIRCRMNMFEDGNKYYAEMSFDMKLIFGDPDCDWLPIEPDCDNVNGHESGGEAPKDVAGMAWKDDWWNMTSDDTRVATETSEFVEVYPPTTGGDGASFKIDDAGITDEVWDGRTPTYHMGVYLTPTNDTIYSPVSRQVYGAYSHTWSNALFGINLSSVSVGWSATGPTVGATIGLSGNNFASKSTTTRPDGYTNLAVKQSEAISDGRCPRGRC